MRVSTAILVTLFAFTACGGEGVGSNGNNNNQVQAACGDGTVDSGEVCDDGNVVDGASEIAPQIGRSTPEGSPPGSDRRSFPRQLGRELVERCGGFDGFDPARSFCAQAFKCLLDFHGFREVSGGLHGSDS